MPVAPDEIYSIVDHPGDPIWIIPGYQTLFGNKWQWPRIILSWANDEERAMPVLLLSGIPAVIFVGGVGYFLVRATH
jgi:hypothetical protein